jgi:hypothetical protein
MKKVGIVPISLWISQAEYEECKAKRWRYGEIFSSGMESKRGMPQIAARMIELEEGNKKLQGKLSQFWQQMAAMNTKVE